MNDRCPACSGEFCVIMGDGHKPCRVFMVGQNPGKTEEAQAAEGRIPQVFVGDASREMWSNYAVLAGITRSEDVYVTNVMHCHTHNDRKPTAREVAGCAGYHLKRELKDCDPKIVLLMGASACSLVPDISLDTHHGYPRKAELFGKSYWVFPSYHPALGMHKPAMMTQLMQDFERLGKVLGGDFSAPTDQYPNPRYEDLTFNREKLEHILHDGTLRLSASKLVNGFLPLMARDTETLSAPNDRKIQPWCSTFTIDPGSGYMVRAIDREGLRILGVWMHEYLGILHNDLFDLNVEEAMGLPYCPYVDTMRLAFHNMDLPLGLKPLAWRLCGMTMKDYSDVVMPYSRDAVLEWLEEAYDIADSVKGTKLVPKKRKIPKTDKALLKLRMELEKYILDPKDSNSDGYLHYYLSEECDTLLTKKILHIFKHTSKTVMPDSTPYSPWDAWSKQIAKLEDPALHDQVHMITSRIGEMPKASIEQVYRRDPQAAIVYACSDSHGTRRIYPELLNMADKYHGRVMAGDIDQ